MKVLDLFSGIGGFSLGLERAGMETVAFCEFDKKAQLVLKKHWPDVPIYDDVKELTYERLKKDGIVAYATHTDDPSSKNKGGRASLQLRRGGGRGNGHDKRNSPRERPTIDLICGGFPCQPFSQAGQRKGEADDRHLWPEYFRLIQEIRPRWVIGENVAGLIGMGLDQVLSDLESEDYSCQTLVIPACAVNAPHRRDRVWILAYTNEYGLYGCEGERDSSRERAFRENESNNGNEVRSKVNGCGQVVAHAKYGGKGRLPIGEKEKHSRFNSNGEDVSDPKCKRQSGQGEYVRSGYTKTHQIGETDRVKCCSQTREGNWDIEPDVGRVAHGIPNRVDRLKQLGNAVVPQVVEQIGRAIMKIERE
jgi:DNA (cytosine-5)-methyltransferase 1